MFGTVVGHVAKHNSGLGGVWVDSRTALMFLCEEKYLYTLDSSASDKEQDT